MQNYVVMLVLVLLTERATSSCPWLCLCSLEGRPRAVDCSGVHFTSFPMGIDSKVENMDLQDNYIRNLPDLDKFSELQVLNLRGNRISKIGSTVFRNLTKLTNLDLSNNSFTHWSQINARMLLSSTVALKTLSLSYNSLKIISGLDGFGSNSLEELYLRSCDISQVDGKSLSKFTKLRYLDLSVNKIKWLLDLASNTLSYLDLSYCDMDSMNPYALSQLPSLTTIKLNGNSQFAINYGNLTSSSLQIFEASFCSLTTPGLYALPNLTYANLRGNKIEYLKERTFVKNKLLVELDLSLNEIRNIHPQAFIAARNLAFVNLSSNSLKSTVPWNTFSTNYNLKVLDLSGNRLESVGNLSILGLEYLDLSQCSIKEIQRDSLTGLPWLMHLNLSHNPLEKIPDDIQSWFLRNIDLSFCRLSAINNETFRRFPEIQKINFTGNRFTNPFKTYMFDFNDRLDRLGLGDNPWICDCDSKDFKAFWDFLTDYPQKIKQSEQKDLKCMFPDSFAGKTWKSACYNEWYPYNEPPTEGFGLTHYGSFLLIIVIIFAGIFAVIGAIKHGIKQRMKQEEEDMQRELARIISSQSRIVTQRRETYNVDEEEEVELRTPRPPERPRTESQLTQPPTYEEAIHMISASREDVLSSESGTAQGPSCNALQRNTSDSDEDEEQIGNYSFGSALSDDDDDDDYEQVPKHIYIAK